MPHPIKAEFCQRLNHDGYAVNSQFKPPSELPNVDSQVIQQVYERSDTRFQFRHQDVTPNVRKISIEGDSCAWQEYCV